MIQLKYTKSNQMKFIRFNFVVTCNQWQSWVMLKLWHISLLHLAVTLGRVNLNRVKLGSAKFIRLGQPTLMPRRVIVRQSLWSFFHEFAVLKPINWTCTCKQTFTKKLCVSRGFCLNKIFKKPNNEVKCFIQETSEPG